MTTALRHQVIAALEIEALMVYAVEEREGYTSGKLSMFCNVTSRRRGRVIERDVCARAGINQLLQASARPT